MKAAQVIGQLCSMRFHADNPWSASVSIGGKQLKKHFPTEREAAIQVDKWVLQYRLNAPLNILKPKA